MTRHEALKAAKRCFERAENISPASPALAQYAMTLVKAGEGYIELAKELRQGS